MTDDQMRLAEALAIERAHGSDGPRWIAGRIVALTSIGDSEGVDRFCAIALAYEKLLAGKPQ
jgi:hypothetical protein